MFSSILKIIKSLLKKTADYETLKADMFLPIWISIFGIVAIIAGLCGIVFNVIYFNAAFIALFSALLLLGMGAILCYSNQKIHILDNSTFQYTTFLGNKKVYRFYDIQGIKRNSDSFTLFVANEKIHIESCAILSARLVEKINEILETKQ